MFDNLRNMAGMAGILKDLPRIKERMEQVKARLGEVIVEAETGGGAVRARASGEMRITAIEIDHALMQGLVDAANPDDRAMAQDLIVGACNAALTKAREAAEKEVSDAVAELGLPLPPSALGGMMM